MSGYRVDGRRPDELREMKITKDYIRHAEGSVLLELGETRVICTASVEERVPAFLRGTDSGWVTAEYGMLPRSTTTRLPREAATGRAGGRTKEIQRLIGRSLRSIVDLKRLPELTIWVDCDVIQADGGTRTASITGSFIALHDALLKLKGDGAIKEWPLKEFIAATSTGIVGDEFFLDLNYDEDFKAKVDFNVAMTESGDFVEIQGTAEERTFGKKELDRLLELAEMGIRSLIEMQKAVLSEGVAKRDQ